MGLVTSSLFLKDSELAMVALSCHIALDMVCQDNAVPGNAGGLEAGLPLLRGPSSRNEGCV